MFECTIHAGAANRTLMPPPPELPACMLSQTCSGKHTTRANTVAACLWPPGAGPLFKQGFVVHSAVHMARHDLECVVHCHHLVRATPLRHY